MEHIAGWHMFGLVLVALADQMASAQNSSTGNDSWLVTASASYDTTITSPNYPLGYSDNMDFTWQVEIENKLNNPLGGYVLKVLFNDFELQHDQALSPTRCPFDNLTFYDGYSESSLFLGSFCGTVHPEVIYSTGNKMSMKFHTDSEMTFRGFSISVSVVEADEAAGICRYPYNDRINMEKVFKYSGTIFSPNYPVPYPDDTLCEWRLYVPNKRMKIKVVDFELRGSSMGDADDDYCYFYMDHVEISDGWLMQENVYCGNQTAFEFYSDLGLMYVRFRTIPTGVRGKRGFKAHFEAVDPLVLVVDEERCLPHNTNNLNLKLSGSYGTLQSPMENYDPGLKCEWLITVPEGKVVELSFDRFQLYPSDPSVECLHNSLQVYDGELRYTKGDSLGTYCDHVVPEPLKSSGRYMWVRFISEIGYDEKNPGFKATFKAVDKKNNYKLIIILGTVCGLIFLVIVVTCICICRSSRKARNTEAGVGIPLSTITTSASRTAEPRVVHDLPQPAGKPYPDPSLAALNTPDSTIPVVPLHPGEESAPQYPPPGELYPWQQSSDSA